ncbi:MAG TPA: VWA domain-containing protein [Thermoanaerobaculia bacterium]|nr:VWA domain-containing protein [Thermoanaerobaculia bacterium]
MVRLRPWSRIAPVLPLLALAWPASGADPNQEIPPLVESVEVEVVNVDVDVTDKDGNSVSGLTADDFEILEDGVPRPITNFYSFSSGFVSSVGEEPAAPAAEPEGFVPPGPTQQRRTAILFDTNTLTRRHRDLAIEAIENFVRERYDEQHEWSVIAYSDHLQYIQRFTNDKLVVLNALDRIKEIPVALSAHLDQPLQTQDPVMAEDVASRRRKFQSGVQVSDMQAVEIRSLVMENLRELDRTTKAMIETMAAHGDLAGRKSLILVTGVMKTIPTMEYILGHAFQGSGSSPDTTDPLLLTLDTDVKARLEGIVRTANATRFSIYPVSALAPTLAAAPHHDVNRRDSGYLFADAASTVPGSIDVESAPKTLAAETGGRFYSTDKVEDALYDIEQRASNSYVLGFTTDHPAEGEYHRLEVQLKRPGFVIRAREGYQHLSDEARMMRALSTPLTFPKAQGDIPVEVQVVKKQGDGKKVPLTVLGTMPIGNVTMVPQGDNLTGRVRLYLAIYDEDGDLVDLVRTHQDVTVPIAERQVAMGAAPAKFGLSVELERGTYTVSLTLRDEVSERFGTGLERLVL